MPRTRTVTVLIAEDMSLLRTGLVSFLNEQDDLEVIAALKCEHHQVALTAAQL